MNALQACCLVASRVAGTWRECFSLPTRRNSSGQEITAAAYISILLLVKIVFPPCICYSAVSTQHACSASVPLHTYTYV